MRRTRALKYHLKIIQVIELEDKTRKPEISLEMPHTISEVENEVSVWHPTMLHTTVSTDLQGMY